MTTDAIQDPQPAVAFTSEAAAKLVEVIEDHPNSVAGLRLQITGRAEGELQHVLSMVEDGAQIEDDIFIKTADGIGVFVERRNVRYLDGIEIHFEDQPGQSGLEFRNPNPLWFDEREAAVQRVFDEQINPAIAAHGGVVSLLAVEDSTAFVEFGGGCQGCGMIAVTLKQGVETAVFEQVPSIDRIIDSTDHDSGENPFYAPEKK
jgi:Fe/S biogenesis protein NfuA